jgi:hypothetical protein
MPLIVGANSVSGYNVANSLRFNSGSTDYLSKNSWATATSDKIFTYSTWVKRSQLANTERLFGAYAGSPQVYSCDLSFTSNNGYIEFTFGGASAYDIATNAMYRDTSAWYHVVLSVDTTQATASNRIIIYVNGTVQTLQVANYPPQNTTYQVFRNNNANLIGSAWNGGAYYSGYMSETYFIDGQQLTPSSFGETDTATGIWKPKSYTGSFGTNGFYLKFGNSAALGTDSSGNGNNFTVNNLTSVDQSTDTCTNNFCTLNFIQNGNGTTSTLTEGNLVAGTADNKGVSANFGVNRGKWYWEVKNAGTQTNQRFGVSNRANEQDGDASPGGATANVRSYVGLNSYKNYSASSDVSDSSFLGTNGTIFGFGLDLDNGTLRRYVNGSLINTDTTLPSDNSVTFFPFTFVTFNFGNWNQAQFNFGSPMYAANSYTDAAGYGNFSYAVPSGYYSLCTKNLANFG